MKEQMQNCILKRRWGKDRCKSFFSRVGKWSELVAKYAACRGYGWNGICRLQYRSVRAYLISSILRWLEFEFEASNWFRVELWLPFVGLCPPSFIIFSFFSFFYTVLYVQGVRKNLLFWFQFPGFTLIFPGNFL